MGMRPLESASFGPLVKPILRSETIRLEAIGWMTVGRAGLAELGLGTEIGTKGPRAGRVTRKDRSATTPRDSGSIAHRFAFPHRWQLLSWGNR